MPRDIVNDARDAPKPVGAYSQAVRAGELLFLAGQIALDPLTGEVVPGDVTAQTQRILANVEAVIRAAGGSLEDVVKATVYLTSPNDFAVVDAAYRKAFDAPYPARTTVVVAGLPLGVGVEIDVIARLPASA